MTCSSDDKTGVSGVQAETQKWSDSKVVLGIIKYHTR